MEYMIDLSDFRNIFFIGVLFLSCYAKAQELNDIVGTWVGCDDRGTYLEIHFSEYESMFVNSDMIRLAYPVPYSIQRNEIHYTNVKLQKTFIDTLYLEGNLLTLKSENYSYLLRKLNDLPVVPLFSRRLGGNLSLSDSILFVHYHRMFLMREAEYKCEGN